MNNFEKDEPEMAEDLWSMFSTFINTKKRSDDFGKVVAEFHDWVDEVITNELKPQDLITVDTFLKALGIYEKTDGDREAEEENKE